MKQFFAKLSFFPALMLVHCGAMAADAASLLAGMAETLSGADRFGVTMVIRHDSVQPSGHSVEFSERRVLLVQRPHKMRVDVTQSDGRQGGLVLDGDLITQFDITEGVYAQLKQPGDLDTTIRYLVSNLGVRVPLARLLVRDLDRELRRSIERVAFVETDRLGEEPLQHIAAVGRSIDAQFWIRPDGLPTRIVLTYRNESGQPRFSADFFDWTLNPETSPGTFAYAIPAGAEKIPVFKRTVPEGTEDSK